MDYSAQCKKNKFWTLPKKFPRTQAIAMKRGVNATTGIGPRVKSVRRFQPSTCSFFAHRCRANSLAKNKVLL